jgi:hypothetical protein
VLAQWNGCAPFQRQHNDPFGRIGVRVATQLKSLDAALPRSLENTCIRIVGDHDADRASDLALLAPSDISRKRGT